MLEEEASHVQGQQISRDWPLPVVLARRRAQQRAEAS